jgi:hypothetical protein
MSMSGSIKTDRNRPMTTATWRANGTVMPPANGDGSAGFDFSLERLRLAIGAKCSIQTWAAQRLKLGIAVGRISILLP